MAAEEAKKDDFYSVLGLNKECTAAELRNAYKKLAMKWHPDRCSASGNSKYVDEAKKRFQAIQQAYSVLSDANKRFLYDVGVYDCDDDDDEDGMGDFLNEMATMMNQNKPNGNRNESFEELQQLFEDTFRSDDTEAFGSSSRSTTPPDRSTTPLTRMSSLDSCSDTNSISNKRNSCDISSSNFTSEANPFEGFCIGGGHHGGIGLGRAAEERRRGRVGGNKRRDGRKQKISSGQDVSSTEYNSVSV